MEFVKEENYIALDKTMPLKARVERTSNFWAIFEDRNEIGNWFLYSNHTEANVLKEYAFEIAKSKTLDDFGLLEKDEKIVVAGSKLFSSPIKGETIPMRTWEEFDDIDKAKEFIEKLASTISIYIFSSKDDIRDKVVKEYKEFVEKLEAKRMRKVHFDGDIIITDPCYLIRERDEANKPSTKDFYSYKSIEEYPDYDGETQTSSLFEEENNKYDEAYKKWNEENPDDRSKWDNDNLEEFGFSTYLTHDTIYGDWGCTTYNDDTDEPIGEFCADSGMVGVFLLSEVLKYNKDFDYHLKRLWTTTLIKDFHGDVWFEILGGDRLIVKGKGNVNFETAQTSL